MHFKHRVKYWFFIRVANKWVNPIGMPGAESKKKDRVETCLGVAINFCGNWNEYNLLFVGFCDGIYDPLGIFLKDKYFLTFLN